MYVLTFSLDEMEKDWKCETNNIFFVSNYYWSLLILSMLLLLFFFNLIKQD